QGLDMYGAVSCCQLKFEFTMREPYVFEGLKAWKPVLAAGQAGAAALYADPAFRQAVKDELAIPVRRIFSGDWSKVQVVMVRDAERRGREGRSVALLAAQENKHPFDWLLDLALTENLETVFTAVLLNSDDEQVGRLLRHPNSILSLSDAGAHVTFF